MVSGSWTARALGQLLLNGGEREGFSIHSPTPTPTSAFWFPCRCSSGFDRYRQEWLAYGCAQEVRGFPGPGCGELQGGQQALAWLLCSRGLVLGEIVPSAWDSDPLGGCAPGGICKATAAPAFSLWGWQSFWE